MPVVGVFTNWFKHNLYGGPYGGKQNYFVNLRNGLSQSTYDQIITYFLEQSSVYIDSMNLSEWHIYGSSRLGIYQTSINMAYRNVRIVNGVTTQETTTTVAWPSYTLFDIQRGAKRYELTNHLGNVLAVVSDKKIQVCSSTTISYYVADLVSATDYSPGGAPLVGFSYTAPNTNYRFGYNAGSEKDDEISGEGNNYTTYFREIDVKLLRMWSDDPTRKAWESPYVLNHNSFLVFVDPFGDDPPKRLSFFGTGGRLDNFMKGDDYKNKANKYAVDNNIDETKITSGWNIAKKTNYISMRLPYKKGEVGGAYEKMFLDSDPVDGNPSDWAGNCPYQMTGFGIDASDKSSFKSQIGAQGSITNSSRYYSMSETGHNFANTTTLSGEAKLSAAFPMPSKKKNESELFGYMFFSNKRTLEGSYQPKLYSSTTFSLIYFKIQYKTVMGLNLSDETWEVKFGFTTKLTETIVNLDKSYGTDQKLTNITTEK